jgi:peptide subunit release factor RF-3
MTDAPTEIARRHTFAIISHPDAGAHSPLLTPP